MKNRVVYEADFGMTAEADFINSFIIIKQKARCTLQRAICFMIMKRLFKPPVMLSLSKHLYRFVESIELLTR